MESIQNIVEYYDELFPIDENIKNFYTNLIKETDAPARFLGIASNTGTLEFFLAKKSCDVTGIEVSQPLLESSILKRRTQLLSIRFFQLSILEMKKFLGKKFYNVIYCLNNRITYIRNSNYMQQFFIDCKDLLQDNGKIVLQIHNYDLLKNEKQIELSKQKSIRVTLSTTISQKEDKKVYISQNLETGNGKLLPIMKDEEVFPLSCKNIINFGKKAGFKNFEFYSDFSLNPLTDDCENIIAIIS